MGTMLAINGNIINSQEPLPIPVDYDYLGETTGTAEITIPEGYDEVYCDIIDSSSNTYYNTSFIVDFESRYRRGGYYINASNYGGWIIAWDSSTRKAKLFGLQSVGHDYLSTGKVKWYAMKHIMQSGGSAQAIPNNIGPNVSLTLNTPYVTPSMGYFTLHSSNASNGLSGQIKGADGNNYINFSIGNGLHSTVFVPAGVTITWIYSSGEGGAADFKPLY